MGARSGGARTFASDKTTRCTPGYVGCSQPVRVVCLFCACSMLQLTARISVHVRTVGLAAYGVRPPKRGGLRAALGNCTLDSSAMLKLYCVVLFGGAPFPPAAALHPSVLHLLRDPTLVLVAFVPNGCAWVPALHETIALSGPGLPCICARARCTGRTVGLDFDSINLLQLVVRIMEVKRWGTVAAHLALGQQRTAGVVLTEEDSQRCTDVANLLRTYASGMVQHPQDRSVQQTKRRRISLLGTYKHLRGGHSIHVNALADAGGSCSFPSSSALIRREGGE